jgi:hypothetical protein
MNAARLIAAAVLGLVTTQICAQPGRQPVTTNKYHVTDEERAACEGDAVALCSTAFPDEELLLGCMKTNRTQLTPICRTTFEAGLRKRRIPF